MTALSKDSVVVGMSLTPTQRMTASRKKLVAYMARGDSEDPADEQQAQNADFLGESDRPKKSLLHGFVTTLHNWWRHHPAKLALEIAEPALSEYARNKPYQLLGISAAAGVATVLIRPWRLFSVTSLLVAIVKSSGIANMALSMLTSRPKPRVPDNNTVP